jgi:predicted RNase H-like HicB family nuclease
LTSALRHQYSCDNGHTFVLERTVRNHLDKLKLEGAIQKTMRAPTGKPGRAPEVYHLSDDFKTKLDAYLNVKEMILGVQLTARLVPTTDEDRKRREALGIVPCPSCGSPTNKSDLLRVQGAEKDSCLTEYCESVKKCIHSIKHEDGSWSETIVGISGMVAEGKTKDECRTELMKKLMDWRAEKQQTGLPIPPPPSHVFGILEPSRYRTRS